MQDKYEDMAIALAGMVQAIILVRELAQTGKVNDEAFQTCLRSIFQTNPKNTLETFGETKNIELGLQYLLIALKPKSQNDQQIIRYMLALMRIQKKIFASPKLLTTLTQRINQTKKQVDYFSLTHPTVISNLADIYLTAIAPFRVKLLIAGNQRALASQDTLEKIRALLLSTIRSAVLWRQVGGSRLQLLLFNKKIKAAAEKLLRKIA